jgi:hypothetical protein
MIAFITFLASSSVIAGQAARKMPLQERAEPPPRCGIFASLSPSEMVLQMPLWLRWIFFNDSHRSKLTQVFFNDFHRSELN